MKRRTFVADLGTFVGQEVLLRGWVRRIRETKSTTFILLQDTSGIVQVVAAPSEVPVLKSEDSIELLGRVREEPRAKSGLEIDLQDVKVLAPAAHNLPFTSATNLGKISQEIVLAYRPLSLRTDWGGTIFRVQAALVEGFREGLRKRRFTEIFTSKIVAGGTEGGANLFTIQYFDRVAYLAQSPQFYKEHGVAGLERVFETGHVYRAEPHATSRHLTEYYSLDFEMGFITGPEEVIQIQRELLTEMFEEIRRLFEGNLHMFNAYLPSLLNTPVWEFAECLDRLQRIHGRTDLIDDLDPEAERQLCAMAEKETGVAAVYVLGFPMSQRPFYTHPNKDRRYSLGFDLLFRGLEVTTGGQRLHLRSDLEGALISRGVSPSSFEPHLRMYDLGMPPHGGLAIGAERLTAQVLGLSNVREATLYPRDRYHIEP